MGNQQSVLEHDSHFALSSQLVISRDAMHPSRAISFYATFFGFCCLTSHVSARLGSSSSRSSSSRSAQQKFSSSSSPDDGVGGEDFDSDDAIDCNLSQLMKSLDELQENERRANKTTTLITSPMMTEIRSCLLRRKVQGLNYDPLMSPDFPHNTIVNISVWPMALSDVNEADELITMQVAVTLDWFDERLRWPDELLKKFNLSIAQPDTLRRWPIPYNIWSQTDGHYVYTEPKAWRPAVVTQEAIQFGDSGLKSLRLTGYYDGTLRLRGEFMGGRSCQIRTRFFPFDRQCCPFTIAASNMARLRSVRPSEQFLEEAWQVVSGQAAENNSNDKVDLGYQTGEWIMHAERRFLQYALYTDRVRPEFDLIDSDVQLLQYRVILTRKPSQYILYNIVPPIIFSLFTPIAVFVGSEPSERQGFVAVILVTMSVMLNELRERLAVGVDGYPVLGQMYMGLMLSLILTAGLSSLSETLYANDESKPKPGLAFFESAKKLVSRRTFGDWIRDAWQFLVCNCAKLPTRRSTFNRALMCIILALQFFVVAGSVWMWMMQPMGHLAGVFGYAENIEDLCD